MRAKHAHDETLLALALAGLLVSTPASAQSPVCGELQSQYLSFLQAQHGNAPEASAGNLARQLAQARRAASQAGCNHFLFFGPRPSPQCPAIMGDIRRMESDLQQIGRRSYGASGSSRQLAQVRAALVANGCPIPQEQAAATGGTYRALCVRLCDGYYFPIASAAKRSQFKTDSAACQSMYAGEGLAKLFVQRQGADVTDATSLDGERYGDQSYALAYRSSYDPSCAIELKNGLAALAHRYGEAQPAASANAAGEQVPKPLPVPRPVATEDPETKANAIGDLSIAEAKSVAASSASSIRVVGDPYYAQMLNATNPKPKQGALSTPTAMTDAEPTSGATASLQSTGMEPGPPGTGLP